MIKIKLKDVRTQMNVSQNELARKLEMSVSYIRKLETGKTSSIPFQTLDKLCQALHCEVGHLMEWIPEETS
jgi:putative transcriptional regulator